MARALMKFPNGKIWLVDDNGRFSGIVDLSSLKKHYNPTVIDIIDAIGECIEPGIAYSMAGNSAIFTAYYKGEDAIEVDINDDKIGLEIMEQFGLNAGNLGHAISSLDAEYQDECITTTLSGRKIHTPAYPTDCSYVRITYCGLELAYWDHAEWAEAPAEVMGAIMGAAHGK